MSDSLRRIYNTVDSLFDHAAISQESRFSRDDRESRHPKTALQVFKTIQPFAFDLDRQAQLKLIVSQQGVSTDGASAHWEFFFDLVKRRAQLVCDWSLSRNEALNDYQAGRIEVIIKPFPPMGSPIRQMVKEGKLLHRQMVGMWNQECGRLPSLPHEFRDTDAIFAEFTQQGLDVTQAEFSLTTGQSPEGSLCWIAQTRRENYYAAFEK